MSFSSGLSGHFGNNNWGKNGVGESGCKLAGGPSPLVQGSCIRLLEHMAKESCPLAHWPRSLQKAGFRSERIEERWAKIDVIFAFFSFFFSFLFWLSEKSF